MQVVSDLHLEFYRKPDTIAQELINSAHDAKYLVLAGDICPYSRKSKSKNLMIGGGRLKIFLTELKSGPWERIFYVPGNHEYYSKLSIDEINLGLQQLCLDIGIDFLNQTQIELPECILLGTPLWGDLDLSKESELCAGLSDFISIHTQSSKWENNLKTQPEIKLSFSKYLKLHRQDVDWLGNTLLTLEPRGSKPIWVITHHPPTQIKEVDDLSSAYNGKVEHLIKKVDGWIFGHTHQHVEMNIDNCQLVCNPRGYSHQVGQIGYINGFQVKFENLLEDLD